MSQPQQPRAGSVQTARSDVRVRDAEIVGHLRETANKQLEAAIKVTQDPQAQAKLRSDLKGVHDALRGGSDSQAAQLLKGVIDGRRGQDGHKAALARLEPAQRALARVLATEDAVVRDAELKAARELSDTQGSAEGPIRASLERAATGMAHVYDVIKARRCQNIDLIKAAKTCLAANHPADAKHSLDKFRSVNQNDAIGQFGRLVLDDVRDALGHASLFQSCAAIDKCCAEWQRHHDPSPMLSKLQCAAQEERVANARALVNAARTLLDADLHHIAQPSVQQDIRTKLRDAYRDLYEAIRLAGGTQHPWLLAHILALLRDANAADEELLFAHGQLVAEEKVAARQIYWTLVCLAQKHTPSMRQADGPAEVVAGRTFDPAQARLLGEAMREWQAGAWNKLASTLGVLNEALEHDLLQSHGSIDAARQLAKSKAARELAEEMAEMSSST